MQLLRYHQIVGASSEHAAITGGRKIALDAGFARRDEPLRLADDRRYAIGDLVFDRDGQTFRELRIGDVRPYGLARPGVGKFPPEVKRAIILPNADLES